MSNINDQENIDLKEEMPKIDIDKLLVTDEDKLFYRVDNTEIFSEKVVAPRYSYWRSVLRVFFRKKINIVILALLGFIIIMSFIYPLFTQYNPTDYKINPNLSNTESYHLSPTQAFKFFNETSLKWIFGTGSLGDSTFDGIWHSAKTSISLAFICAAINLVVGILIGAVWGFSKKVDIVMTEVYNIIANVPYLLFVTVFVYVVGSGFWSFVAALTITGWLGIAYFIRTQVIIIRDREYNLASKCLGTSTLRLVTKNILPFLTSVIVTITASEIPSYISYEVFLSYIGIGLSAKEASIGQMIQKAQGNYQTYPWEFWCPVAVVSIITVILYIVGQNLADASDPRTHM